MKKIIIILLFQTFIYTQVPPPPVFLGLDDSTSLTPRLLWSNVPSATSYGLQISTSPSFPVVIINQSNIPDTFYQLPFGLLYITIYYVRLNAANSYGSGLWSDVYYFILHPPVSIKIMTSEIPDKFSLSQNYPNPFNPVTKIKFSLPLPSKGGVMYVQLKVYDVLGRELAILFSSPSGRTGGATYEVEWDGSNYPSGVYFYKLVSSEYSETKKMVLIK
jgi:hypothetical protein